MYRLPDGSETTGAGWTMIDDIQYHLDRMTVAELEAIGVERFEPAQPAFVDPRFYYISGTGAPIPRPIEEVHTTLKSQIASERWDLEQSNVTWNEHKAQTDRESRANYLGMVDATDKGLRPDGGIYKFVDGLFPLANADVTPLAMTVMQYIQSLYNKEAVIAAQIEALQTVEEAEAFTWTWD